LTKTNFFSASFYWKGRAVLSKQFCFRLFDSFVSKRFLHALPFRISFAMSRNRDSCFKTCRVTLCWDSLGKAN